MTCSGHLALMVFGLAATLLPVKAIRANLKAAMDTNKVVPPSKQRIAQQFVVATANEAGTHTHGNPEKCKTLGEEVIRIVNVDVRNKRVAAMAILAVQEDDAAIAKKAYRKLAFSAHPDNINKYCDARLSDPSLGFVELCNEAFKMLTAANHIMQGGAGTLTTSEYKTNCEDTQQRREGGEPKPKHREPKRAGSHATSETEARRQRQRQADLEAQLERQRQQRLRDERNRREAARKAENQRREQEARQKLREKLDRLEREAQKRGEVKKLMARDFPDYTKRLAASQEARARKKEKEKAQQLQIEEFVASFVSCEAAVPGSRTRGADKWYSKLSKPATTSDIVESFPLCKCPRSAPRLACGMTDLTYLTTDGRKFDATIVLKKCWKLKGAKMKAGCFDGTRVQAALAEEKLREQDAIEAMEEQTKPDSEGLKYLVPSAWMKHWQYYIYQAENTKRPGPISTETLLADMKQRELYALEDYYFLSKAKWDYFVEKYGVWGPPIIRHPGQGIYAQRRLKVGAVVSRVDDNGSSKYKVLEKTRITVLGKERKVYWIGAISSSGTIGKTLIVGKKDVVVESGGDDDTDDDNHNFETMTWADLKTWWPHYARAE